MSKYLLNTALLALLFVVTSVNVSFAQDEAEESKFSISGTADTYFRTNFNGLNKELTEEVLMLFLILQDILVLVKLLTKCMLTLM